MKKWRCIFFFRNRRRRPFRCEIQAKNNLEATTKAIDTMFDNHIDPRSVTMLLKRIYEP